MTIKDPPLRVDGFTHAKLRREGSIVSVHLDCGDVYKALLLFEDMADRVKRQTISICLGPDNKP